MSLKQKALSGLSWSFADNIINQAILFIVGIILARLLSPQEFGLIGMITIFIAISQSFIDSGFSQALIREPNCKQTDYCTVFFFNLFIGAICYLILFLSAGAISNFFKEPQLLLLVRVLGINLIINALGLVQRTILIKNIDFKSQTKISIIASTSSGVIGIAMAYYGFGVWSLVWKTTSQNIFQTSLLWIYNRWVPQITFSYNSFKKMFSFGSKLLLSGLIYMVHNNIYYLIIGKFFSATELGYYTRADHFRNMPSQNISGIIQRVSYPVLSTIQEDTPTLKNAYRKLIKNTMFITFTLMLGMAAVAKPMVLTLIGEKWLPAVPYLQLLCFAGMLYPLHALNLNMLNVKGRSDLFLKLEVIKLLLAIPIMIVGIFWGIKVMIIGMIFSSFIAYFLNSYWSGKMVNYPVKEQILDIAPSFIIATIMGISVFVLGNSLSLQPIVTLCIQIPVGALIALGIARLIKLDAYMEIRDIVLEKLTA